MKSFFVFFAAAVAAFAQTGNADNGKRIFMKDGCYQCHGYAGPVGRCFQRIRDAELLGEVLEKGVEGFLRFARRRLQRPDREVEGIGRLRRSAGEH